MWILPKNLDTSLTAQDTMESESDLNSLGSILASLFMWRSKPSQSSTCLKKWKREPWVKELSGRILKPSQSLSFEDVLIFCLEDSPASPSAQPESVAETKTSDTSFPTSLTELKPCVPLSSSLKTSMESPAQLSKEIIGEIPQEPRFCSMSLENWNEWVTEQRQFRRARQKSVLLTNATDGSLSAWPTISTRDVKGVSGQGRQEGKGHPLDTLPNAVLLGRPAPDRSNSDGSRPELFPTPNLPNRGVCKAEMNRRSPDLQNPVANGDKNAPKLNPRWVETLMGLPVGWTMPSCVCPVTIVPMSCVSLGTESCLSPVPTLCLEGCENSWPTPAVFDTTGGHKTEFREGAFRSKHDNKPDSPWYGAKLRDAVVSVESWATINTMDYMEQRSPEALKRQAETTRKGRTKPANPREQVNPEAVEIYRGTQ